MVFQYHRRFRVYINATSTPQRKSRNRAHEPAIAGSGYGLKVSPDLISRVTDAVLDEVRERQRRALDRMYPIVLFDALRVKIRDADSRTVKNKAVYFGRNVREWFAARNQFAIMFGERIDA